MFSDTLELKLDLAIGNDLFQVPSGKIKNFTIDLTSYGFDASADFWISSDVTRDKLFPRFKSKDLIECRLALKAVYNLPKPAPDPLVVKGPVTLKSVRELTYEKVKGQPVLFRHYEVHFQDAARMLWRQHYPAALYEGTRMADVINAHLVKGISLDMKWDELETEMPMICLGSGADRMEASFYDFILWYTASRNGAWTYDSQEQTYRLSAVQETVGRMVSLTPEEVQKVHVHIPETVRHSKRVLNACSELPQTVEIDQDHAVSGTYQDVWLRTSIGSEFESRKRLEAEKRLNGRHEIEVVLNQFPTKTIRTGTPVHFDLKAWSKKHFPFGRKYRVGRIQVDGRAAKRDPLQELGTEHAVYRMDMRARLEQEDSTHVNLPAYRRPHYPIYAEGTIVSEIGEDTDKTYQVTNDENTSLDYYTVRVPIWNKEIRVPYTPGLISGHFYFPAFKNTRVLLALYFDRAEIARFLEWGDDVRLPEGSQGNHLLMGKNAESQVSLRHVYENNRPVFSIERLSGIDTEFIQLKEGVIVLQTGEDEDRKEKKGTL